MSKKQNKNDTAQENQELEKARREFGPKKKIMEEEMLNGLIQYVRDGIFPKSKPGSYMTCYNIIYEFTDRQIGEEILKYHNDIIEKSSSECYNKINNLSGIDFLDSFIDCTSKLNILIYYMSRIFLYISNNHLKSVEEKQNERKYEENDVSEFSMKKYKKFFFDKLEGKLYTNLNEILIRDERNGNNENQIKILNIMKTLSYMDYKKPKIVKSSATAMIWQETATENITQDLPYQKKWYNEYFRKETIKYLKNKSEKDIKTFSAPEYVKCELKYIAQEHQRESNYIHEIFHSDINDLNYE